MQVLSPGFSFSRKCVYWSLFSGYVQGSCQCLFPVQKDEFVASCQKDFSLVGWLVGHFVVIHQHSDVIHSGVSFHPCSGKILFTTWLQDSFAGCWSRYALRTASLSPHCFHNSGPTARITIQILPPLPAESAANPAADKEIRAIGPGRYCGPRRWSV